MSVLSKFLLCCFYPSHDEDEEAPPETNHNPPPIVPRKPVPYAMINVPHYPDTLNEQAFHRMLTASPACPVVTMPYSNSHQQTEKSKKKQHLVPRGSLDVNYVFNPGKVSPTPHQAEASDAGQKASTSGAREKSPKGKECENTRGETCKDYKHPIDDHNAVKLIAGPSSTTDLNDVLKSGTLSNDGYDSDAKTIKTPELDTAVTTVKGTLEHASKPLDGTESKPDPSTPYSPSLPSLIETLQLNPPTHSPQPLPRPSTPEKISFTQALQPQPFNGQVSRPTEVELRNLARTNSDEMSQDWKQMLHAPQMWPSSTKEPDTPQTVIRRLNSPLQANSNVEPLHVASEATFESKSRSLATQSEPGMLEHSSKVCESKPSDVLSDNNSVHLFNMNIPARLASKSNATVLSPAASHNASRRALDSPVPMPKMPQLTPAKRGLSARSERAEHNRRPSDPHTRRLFEEPGRRYHPYWRVSTATVDQSSKSSVMRDDTSSIYSVDSRLPPSRGDSSKLKSLQSIKRNPNSMAIGGRSASTEIPTRRSSRTHSPAGSTQRQFFAFGPDKYGQLAAASEVINRYVDGKYDCQLEAIDNYRFACDNTNIAKPRVLRVVNGDTNSEVSSLDNKSGDNKSEISSLDNMSANEVDAEHNDLEWPTPRPGIGCGYANTDVTAAPPSMESATEIWNRAYVQACADSWGRDLLTPSSRNSRNIHRRSSFSSLRLRQRSSSILQTPRSAVRRSWSAGPGGRRTLRAVKTDKKASAGHLAKTMKKLSFWQLKASRDQEAEETVARTLRERSDSEVVKRRSFSAFERHNAMALRATHTPPLSHYLGYWGSFPSHDRTERNGPAGELDEVHAHNFGFEQANQDQVGAALTPLKGQTSMSTLSAMQSKTKRIFSGLSNNLDRKSSVVPGHKVEKNRGVFAARRQRRNQARISQWQNYMTSTGRQTAIFNHPSTEMDGFVSTDRLMV